MDYVLTKHADEERLTVPAKLVNGHDIINIFGLVPGPRFAEILESVREAQATGEVTTRDEALDYLKKVLHIPLRKDK
jgi:poly(A) polymerase